MIENNWIYNYRTIEGIGKTLQGMNRRTKNISQMHLAVEDLTLHYTEFENDFTIFFKKLCTFSNEKIISLKS